MRLQGVASLDLPRSSHTQVVEVASGKVVLDITGNQSSHGVALVPAQNRGFISNGKDGTVQIFDLRTGAELGRLPAADDGIIHDPATNRVLVMWGDAGKLVTFAGDVDPKSGKADGSIEVLRRMARCWARTVYLPTADLKGGGPRPQPVPGTFKVPVVTR